MITGRSIVRPTARMPGSGGLMIASNEVTPNMPRFETVNVPPSISCWRTLPLRARATMSLVAAAISVSVMRSASRSTGTIRPSSSATAMPTCACSWCTMRSPSHERWNCGCSISETAQARMIRSLIETFVPPSPSERLISRRSSIARVMSTSDCR